MALCGGRRRRDEMAQIDARQSDPGSACAYQRDAAEQAHTHSGFLSSPLSFVFFSSFYADNEHDRVTGQLFIQQVTPRLWLH